MAALSLSILIINFVSGGQINSLFAIRYTSFTDPMMYLRLFTHSITHANMSHYTGNFLMLMVIGPLVEEKYGSKVTAVMVCITSVVTGLANIIFFRNVMLLGASGVVFMFVLIASFTNIRQGKIPVTVLLVAALYIGNEIIAGLTIKDQISRTSHILGGICGAAFGFVFNSDKMAKKSE